MVSAIINQEDKHITQDKDFVSLLESFFVICEIKAI